MAKVSLRAYNREIETMIDSGHLDEAIANCRHILKTFPKHLETYRLLGKAYLEYKRYPEAVNIFSRVLVAVPDDFVANVGMSIIRDEENRLDDAIWHMERAFETQPSNAAIQAELQRLYGRRDGVQPPRIRMTRGALAHMYVQGELYPQAISEIKSVLKEDAGRVDMQALLARACYRSGLKNEAADVASSALRTYPYCLDANRVLLEILGSDRSESAQVYRQRVVELDPYAAHVMGTVFQSEEAPEAAVNVERLDWNGQPVSLQPDWGTAQAITLEEDQTQEEQPDWLRSVFEEPVTQPPPHPLGSVPDQPRIVPAFDTSLPPASGGESNEEIPDFLREAGWGKSTGAFDESKSAFANEEPETEPPLAKGELPDWVKAMAPKEAQQPSEEEELPDWINKIGTGAPSVSADSDSQLDWIRRLDQPAQAQPSDSQPDWLNQFNQPESSAGAESDDTPDWLKGLGSESETAPAGTPMEKTDWTSQLEQPAPFQTKPESSEDQLDWLKQLDQSEQPAASAANDQPDWLKGLDKESTPAATPMEQRDWMSELEQPRQTEAESQLSEEQPDWLKGFSSEEPVQTGELDWLKQIGEQTEPAPFESSSTEAVSRSSDQSLPEEGIGEPQQPVSPSEPVLSTMDQLGTSEQERDDSFAWLESLAARQGTSEGLLTNPDDRSEEEPDWVKRAKGLSTDDVPTQPAPASQPSGNLEELGTTEQERDDSFAWLESLAARQGASEGLLTKPEERMEEEPDWVKRARDLSQAAEETPAPSSAEEPSLASDDTGLWLRSLEQEEPTDVPSSGKDATGMWLKSLDEGLVDFRPGQPAEEPEPEVPIWMQNIEEERAGETSVPAAEAEAEKPEAEIPAWMQKVADEGSAEPTAPPIAAEEMAPASSDSMRSMEEAAEVQDAQSPEQPETELPAWMRSIAEEQSVEMSEPPVTMGEATAEESDWMRSSEESTEVQATESPEAESPTWVQNIEEEKPAESQPVMSMGEVEVDMPATKTEQPAPVDDLPEWMQFIEDKEAAEASTPAPPVEEAAAEVTEWISSFEETAAPTEPLEQEQPAANEEIPAWLSSLDEEETQVKIPGASDDLPAWLRGEEEPAPEPSELEPSRATDWQPVEEKLPETSVPVGSTEEIPEPVASFLGEQEAPAAVPEAPSEPPKEAVVPIDEAMAEMPVDPILGQARESLSKGDVSGSLSTYGKLIKKTRLLDEVIYDLREALDRYPVDVSIWQSLGDAYMRANRLQDALDAYTKAEELLR